MMKRIAAIIASAAMTFTAIPITGTITASAEGSNVGSEPNVVTEPVQMEYLDRGTVAVKINNGVYLSWRLLGTEEYDTAFDVYRDGKKITTVSNSTNYTDKAGTANSTYTVVPKGTSIVNTIDFEGSHVTGCALEDGLTAYAAKYNDGILEKVYFEPVSGDIDFDAGFEVDKVFLWDGMTPAENRAVKGTSVWESNALKIPLDKPAAVKLADGNTYEYTANDASVGDLDGDGDYEIILKWDCNGKDNSQDGYTGNVLIDAYDLDGTKLWRIDLGPNIRAGAHYTQFIVYDFDLDGRAEIAMKTAPGSKDSVGMYVNAVSLDEEVRSGDNSKSYVGAGGFITEGPEYYSVFDGDGTIIDTVMYPFLRTDSNRQWGLDSAGRPEITNRVDRFLGTTAYLDGVHPSIITWRGYYAKTTVAAYTLEKGKLIKGNTFNAETNAQFSGQGNHNLTVGDVDGDGKDEIICGALALDDDLSVLWSSGRGHGDALHLGDYDPTHLGLEYFSVHESGGYAISGSTNGNDGKSADYGMTVYDAADGTELGHWSAGSDTGRGMMANIGAGGYYQITSGAGNYRANGGTSFTRGNYGMSQNFRIFWDGDTYDELLDGTSITNYTGGRNMSTIFTADGCVAINGTKANPAISADILGDWREEVVYPTNDSTALMLYTTTTETNNKLYTLMHDRGYRMQVTSEQTAYNQPPHISYYISENKDMFDAREYAAYVKTVHNGVTAQRKTNTNGKDVTVDITINFLDEDNNPLRDPIMAEAVIGTTYYVPDEYLADLNYDESTKMCYRYLSGNDGLNVGNDPSATKEINLVFRYMKSEIDYAVDAVDENGTVVKTLYSGTYRPNSGSVTRYGDYGIVGDDGKYYILADMSESSVTFEPTEEEPSASIIYKEVDGNGVEIDFENGDTSMFETNDYISVTAENSTDSAINDEKVAKASVVIKGEYPKESASNYGIASWDLSQYVDGYKKVTVSYDTYFEFSDAGRMSISLLDKAPESCWDAGWYRIQHHRPGGGKTQGLWFDGNNESKSDYLNRWIRGTFTLDFDTGEASWIFTDRETGEKISLWTNSRTYDDLRALQSLTLMTWQPKNFTTYLDNMSVIAYEGNNEVVPTETPTETPTEAPTETPTAEPTPLPKFEVDSEGTLTSCRGFDTDVEIPSEINGVTVTAIRRNVFNDNYNLRTVKLPETVKTIKYYAFGGMYITSINLENVTEIERQAFYNCEYLKEVDLSSAAVIGQSAFEGCSDLRTVYLSPDLEILEYRTFYDCDRLKDVYILNPNMEIGYSAFPKYPEFTVHGYTGSTAEEYADENGLDFVPLDEDSTSNPDFEVDEDGVLIKYTGSAINIVIPSMVDGITITEIRNNVFRENTSVKTVVLPETIKKIGENAFQLSSVESINLENVEYIDAFAFDSCKGLVEVNLDSAETIERRAFANCSALETVYLSPKLEYISYGIFANCNNFKDVYIPNPNMEIDPTFEIHENLTIHGYAGSTAEEFANDCGWHFEPLD